jgi:hypothetical protein
MGGGRSTGAAVELDMAGVVYLRKGGKEDRWTPQPCAGRPRISY